MVIVHFLCFLKVVDISTNQTKIYTTIFNITKLYDITYGNLHDIYHLLLYILALKPSPQNLPSDCSELYVPIEPFQTPMIRWNP